MTTIEIIAAAAFTGYLAGGITGFYIGAEYTEAPVVDEPVHPAIIDMEYIDSVSGCDIQSSTSIYLEERPDGSLKQYIIQNN